MNGEEAVLAYRRQQVETASPAQLVVMLYDGCIRHCRAAQEAIAREGRDAAARHLLKAQDIVSELMACLNLDAGGEIATRLLRLYEYMYRRLVLANVRKDASAVREVEGLLVGLRDAWAQVASTPPATMQPASDRGAGPVA
ncbi:flagellar export chaperone FliS [Geochorda subterranea]|uniref:Flagellar secretion chaperone FliS n=1 Tax=Geochorda subterranea TaxID=3109564 RepID=A0ABZ1BUI9_9FIRM|nr:flagellar export chaperone FliS [Limnochorda sp. LNt]WRP15787.1 flagellar export chaperone FliS [Limnochorda sp. LNt]